MRQAMAAAEVGDEQRGEDPTVNLLLERVAELLAKPAALFLPGGTMCNHVAIAAHTRPGDAILAERGSHVLRSESAGAVALAHVQTEAIDGSDGRFPARAVRERAAKGSLYEPPTTLLCLEQTHNFAGGTVWPVGDVAEVCLAAHDCGMRVHMDGARLLNAVIATGVPAQAFVEHVDSVWICFTKGLGAPLGAVLAGPSAFIERARRLKHIAGGGLRQAGIVAAGCLYALDHHVERLAEDHANAQRLAEKLAEHQELAVLTPRPDTNMVFFKVAAPQWTHETFLRCLAERGVLIGPVGDRLRAVTHLDIHRADVDRALAVVAAVLREGA